MLKKRIVATILVKDEWAVQSFGYNNYLPLGDPVVLAQNFDRWGADEIIILDLSKSLSSSSPNFGLVKQIASLGLSTPLSYGGGISSLADALKIISLGVERIVIDSMLRHRRRRYSISPRLGVKHLLHVLHALTILCSIFLI